MHYAVSELQTIRFICTVRFVQGYRYLDRCGEAVIRLEESLDEGWIPIELAPSGGKLRNYTLGMAASFDSESFSTVQSEFLSFDHFRDQTCRMYEVLRTVFGIKRVYTPVLRAIFQIGFPDTDSAETFLTTLALSTPSPDLLEAVGGDPATFNLTLCTHENITVQGCKVRRRRRFDSRVIRQERQPNFDQRMIMRLPLLTRRTQDAMQTLRKLRNKHPTVADVAAQFDVENALESEEFSSGMFDLPAFLSEAHQWTEKVKVFLQTQVKSCQTKEAH